MLKVLRQRIAERSVENLSVLKGDMSFMPIADSSADHVLAAFVYHEVGSQARLVEECARILRPGGRLTIIDFQKRLGGDGPPIWVRKSPAHVKKTARRLLSLASSDMTKAYYQLTFTKN
jgi:ubiquinone/menaquinone biosynthesis C-methylase UbiE